MKSRYGGKCADCLHCKACPESGICSCSEGREEHEETHDGCELRYTLADAEYDRDNSKFEGL